MTVLTPELAAKMLDVWARRRRDPQGTVYDSSVLECALYGLPDFAPSHRGVTAYKEIPSWRFKVEGPQMAKRARKKYL